MSDSVKKWHELHEEGWWTQNENHPDLSLILNDDIARDEWEAYYKYHEDALENCKDFEVAYGFVIWIFNRNYKKIQ